MLFGSKTDPFLPDLEFSGKFPVKFFGKILNIWSRFSLKCLPQCLLVILIDGFNFLTILSNIFCFLRNVSLRGNQQSFQKYFAKPGIQIFCQFPVSFLMWQEISFKAFLPGKFFWGLQVTFFCVASNAQAP